MTSPGPEQGYWVCPVHGRIAPMADDAPDGARCLACLRAMEWRAPEAAQGTGEVGTQGPQPERPSASPPASPRASSSLPPQDGERCENCGGSMASDGHDRIEFGGVPILMCPHARTDYREIFVTGGTTGGPAAELARLRTELAAAERKRDEQRALADGLARFAMQFESMARGIGGTRFETTGLLPLLARWRATRGEG